MLNTGLQDAPQPGRSERRTLSGSGPLWIVAGTLLLSTFLHYLTPQIRTLPLVSVPLARHAVERIILLFPVAVGAFYFGYKWGIVVLGLAGLIMLPRVFIISPYPMDALLETAGVVAVGGLLVWQIGGQAQARRECQETARRLEPLHSVSLALGQTVGLDAMLDQALSAILDWMGGPTSRGAIWLLDSTGRNLRLVVQRGLPADWMTGVEVPAGECQCDPADGARQVWMVCHGGTDRRRAPCPETMPHAHACIPLQFKDNLLGVIDICLDGAPPLQAADREILAAIGRQVGAAIENTWLCDSLRFYIQQVTRAQEDERKRVARELHDETAQGLVDLSRRLDALAADWEAQPDPPVAGLESVQEQIATLLHGVRRFSHDLRPLVLDDLGLLPALEGLLDDMGQHAIRPVFVTRGTPRRLPAEVELALFRIVQEGLNNVKKHAGATQVTLEVEFFEGRVRVTVHDNGHGFQRPATLRDLVTRGKLGMVGMEERAQLLGGGLTVLTGPQAGTIVTVDVPAG